MTAQRSLFGERQALPPHNWSATSKRAAQAMRTRAPSKRQRVLAHIVSCGARGATIDELAGALDMLTATVCGRVGELARPADGPALIVDSGQRRETAHGAPAKVLVATVAGVAVCRGR